ncbi:MAG: helix-turn-helix domain-containing protein [Actinomycetota bacterium]|nr:helix-turn-helix domain-containing protein [Actinomycetota bacterium]
MAQQPMPAESEARRLRALAHPLRWRIIGLLEAEGSVTATRCAEALGESVASCSYHLGILGKYGYLEPVPQQGGRERPWRLASQHQDLRPSSDDAVPAALAAAAAFLEHEFARLKARLHNLPHERPEWQEASFVGSTSAYLTAAELHELKDLLHALLQRHEDRKDRAVAPEGARHVRIFVSTSVAPEEP